jgi:hypothetical protein
MGHVVDVFGRPVPGATVRSGLGNVTTTDAQGAFVLQGISPPYNVIVGHKSAKDGSPRGYAFEGLTRADPTLQLGLEDVGASAVSANLAGLLPVDEVSGQESLVFVDLPAGAWPVATNTVEYMSSTTTFSMTATWEGPPQVSAETYLLQWGSDPTGLPSSYQVATGTMSTLSSGQTAAVTFGSPPVPQTGDISISIGVSAGYSVVDTGLFVRPSGAIIAADIVHTPMAVTTLAVPGWSGATYVVCATQQPLGRDASASAPYGRACKTGLSPGSSSVTIAPTTATTLIVPPSTIGVGSEISWSPMSVAGVYAVILEAPAPNPTLLVVTAGTTLKVPDFSGVEASLPSGQSYTLTVIGLAPFASMDDAAGPSGYDGIVVAGQYDHGPASDGQLAFSGPVTVTAQ